MSNYARKIGSVVLALLIILIFGDFVLVKRFEFAFYAIIAVVLILSFLALISFDLMAVEEGTGTAFKLLGKYYCSVMSLKGFRFGADEFIELGSGSSSTNSSWFIWRLGGWVFSVKWIIEPTKYTDQNNHDGFGEGYSVFLNQIQRDITLQKAETAKGEEIPLNLKAAFKMKVVNIYQFLFIAPKDVIAKVIEIMEAIVRGWVKGNLYDTIQQVKSNGGKMCDQFGPDIQSSIRSIKKDWGIEIIEDSIFIMDVGLLPEDQEAYAAKKRQQLKTAAGAQEILGGMLMNVALSLGFKGDDATKKTITDQIVEHLRASTDPADKVQLDAMIARANEVVAQRALGAKVYVFGNLDGSKFDPIMAAAATLASLPKSGSEPPQNPPKTGGGDGGGQNPIGGGSKRKRAPWNQGLGPDQ